MTTKRAAEAEVTRVLRALQALDPSDRDRRTSLLRDLGQATVDLREHFQAPNEARPDWMGRSGEYRTAIGDAYAAAGYGPDDTAATQKAARYHIANAQRLRLSPSEIEALGMRTETPAERQTEIRERNAALVATASAGGTSHQGTDSAAASLQERIELLRGVLATLNGMRPPTAAQRAQRDYPKQQRAAQRLLAAIVKRAETISHTWPPPPREGSEPA